MLPYSTSVTNNMTMRSLVSFVRHITFCLSGFVSLSAAAQLSVLPDRDWLVHPVDAPAEVKLINQGRDLVMGNKLVQRTFRLGPNLVCTGYKNLINGQELLRAVMPEARLTIDGKSLDVGGLSGQSERAYLLPEWVDRLQANPDAFQFQRWEQKPITPTIRWKPVSWASNRHFATGKEVRLHFTHSNPMYRGLQVIVHYEIYDGLPLMAKWLSIHHQGGAAARLDRVMNEVLALVEEESAVVGAPEQMKIPQGIYIESNYAFNNAMRYAISDQTTHWKTDSAYTSQVNYNYQTPCVLEVYPDKAPGIRLQPGETYRSIRTYELLMDSYDRERRGLAIRKMYRTIAPWTTSNPIFMHLVSKKDDEVRQAIDQCTATGYEALILSFGSHIQMEDTSAENLRRWKQHADYAHSKGILIGGYALFSSRKISEEDDVVDPVTGKTGHAFFGNAPCFGSRWGLGFRNRIKRFFEGTGFDIWENDGPYPGDVCASTTHPGHEGLHDSQWRQMEIQKELYRWLNERGVYINAPDWYFLDGTHKIALGYREVNFSLSREQQIILNRQNIHDGTWEKTPSMGWGFVPLTRYQGGGEEAILEPLRLHLKEYRQLMMQYYGAGVQACYRGPRLYDTDTTKAMVKEVISWYKKHREILNADIIHLRRADGRDWDGWLHADPGLREKGMLLLFNPTASPLQQTITIPLYYTGIRQRARVTDETGRKSTLLINTSKEIRLKVTIPAHGYSWWVLEQAE